MDAFWSRVDMSGGPHACWPWRRYICSTGYGQTAWDGRARRTHQIALELAEARPARAHALHHCDNRACCNPLHLYWGTDADNCADRERRQRNGGHRTRGLKNGRAVDLLGRRVGRLLVVEYLGRAPRRGCLWACWCDCGARVERPGKALLHGRGRSCGCLRREVARSRMEELNAVARVAK